jgi:hypothetical protein
MMETKITPIGSMNDEGKIPASLDFELEVVIEAEGHRREDGLTAAQVRQEIKEREGADGS